MDMVELNLVEVEYSPNGGAQILILQEKDGERSFAVYVGGYEAEALLAALEGIRAPRPMSHDLIVGAIEALGGTLTGVWINELVESTFHGKLLVRTPDGETVMVDSRPSDAIVLAAKESVPIYASREVIDEVQFRDEDDEEEAGGEMEDSDDGEF